MQLPIQLNRNHKQKINRRDQKNPNSLGKCIDINQKTLQQLNANNTTYERNSRTCMTVTTKLLFSIFNYQKKLMKQPQHLSK